VDPISVDIRLIRAVLGAELRIAPGRALMARVVRTDARGQGTLSIAGTLVEAKLPKHLRAGEELRLMVRHASAERVVLSLADQAPPPPAIAVPLPGAGSVRVSERDESPARASAREGAHTLSLRYDAPALGEVDLRFELDPSALTVAVAMAPGAPVELGRAGADALRRALGDGVGRAVNVSITARHEPLDLYA
jgi:hypothetical protein